MYPRFRRALTYFLALWFCGLGLPVPAQPLEPAREPSAGVVLAGVALVSQGKWAQVQVLTTGPARIRHGYVRGRSARCFIDVSGASLGNPTVVPTPPPGSSVRRIRVGQFRTQPPVCRIVLELKPGVRPERLTPRGRPPAVLVYPRSRPIPSYRTAAPPPARLHYRVALDPGHGGNDPGALGRNGLREKEVTLDVALRLARYLRARGYPILLSRDKDRTLGPTRRVAWLRGTRSHVLVSVHCDAVRGQPQVSGATTYYHGRHASSRALATQVQAHLARTLRTPSRGVRSDFSRYGSGFYVLRKANRPAVLVEIGYITHAPTAARLKKPSYRQQVAEGIGAGILAYHRQGGARIP